MADKYIHQQDAIDDLHTQLMYRMGSDDMKRRLDDWVTTLPSADVMKVKHGEWISECEPHYECSECHHWFHLYQHMNFCPNCGAKMDREE